MNIPPRRTEETVERLTPKLKQEILEWLDRVIDYMEKCGECEKPKDYSKNREDFQRYLDELGYRVE